VGGQRIVSIRFSAKRSERVSKRERYADLRKHREKEDFCEDDRIAVTGRKVVRNRDTSFEDERIPEELRELTGKKKRLVKLRELLSS
jgi:hypothetical protein